MYHLAGWCPKGSLEQELQNGHHPARRHIRKLHGCSNISCNWLLTVRASDAVVLNVGSKINHRFWFTVVKLHQSGMLTRLMLTKRLIQSTPPSQCLQAYALAHNYYLFKIPLKINKSCQRPFLYCIIYQPSLITMYVLGGTKHRVKHSLTCFGWNSHRINAAMFTPTARNIIRTPSIKKKKKKEFSHSNVKHESCQ